MPTSDKKPYFSAATHTHGVTMIVITPIKGDMGSPSNPMLARDFEFYAGPTSKNKSYAAPDFRVTCFGNEVEWIIPDDVFEAELRRRGELAAAKIHREKQA
jgi:hypothetical protein